MAMRLATGELLCNVDADNRTGHHFAFHVAQRLQEYDFLVGCLYRNDRLDSYCDQGTGGRAAVRRPAFYDAGDFDEAMPAGAMTISTSTNGSKRWDIEVLPSTGGF
jgi:hypothetical protein